MANQKHRKTIVRPRDSKSGRFFDVSSEENNEIKIFLSKNGFGPLKRTFLTIERLQKKSEEK